ncbi:protease adaptor protein SpxH [Hymenobacter saemangeumensis]|uniref:Protease adaptor protein SpxH n=2 Tax=Hymenobacter saemangeumensis TaxID=1084522 RepID=A0ABP8IS57_9BACT
METTTQNPLLCDPESGVCEMPGATAAAPATAPAAQHIKIIYYTDPICSSCWGIEPQLRKLKLEYGHAIDLDYRMGGLLPDWSYNSGGISKPSDVAHHWDEVSAFYDMPIDGDVWLEDPLASSYPPSIAFKAAQLQDRTKAILFLRELRELVFLHKKNIAKWEQIAKAATTAGLDVAQLQSDVAGQGKMLFEQDLALGRQLGVRGFPTLYFVDASGVREVVYGSKPYAALEAAVMKVHPLATKRAYAKTWEALFATYASLTAKEFSDLSGTPRADSEQVLDQLVANGVLDKRTTKNGALWKRRQTPAR